MIFNVKVYSIADKYDVPALKLQAKTRFEKAVKARWNMDDLPHAVSEVYNSTPESDRGLRDPIAVLGWQEAGSTEERISKLLSEMKTVWLQSSEGCTVSAKLIIYRVASSAEGKLKIKEVIDQCGERPQREDAPLAHSRPDENGVTPGQAQPALP